MESEKREERKKEKEREKKWEKEGERDGRGTKGMKIPLLRFDRWKIRCLSGISLLCNGIGQSEMKKG
jgi:hypothetical protein